MKQTDILRREREIKRAQKKEAKIDKSFGKVERSVGDYINDLEALFFHDETKIYNINQDERILEILEEMKIEQPDKQWENIIRKAVKKSGVKEKESAVKELLDLLGI